MTLRYDESEEVASPPDTSSDAFPTVPTEPRPPFAIDAGSSPGSLQQAADKAQHRSQTRLVVRAPTYRHAPRSPLGPDSGPIYPKKFPTVLAGSTQGDRMGAAALIVGICGIALYWLPWVNLMCPALSTVLGGLSLWRVGKGTGASRLPAVAGLILSGVLFLIGLFVIDVALSLATVLD